MFQKIPRHPLTLPPFFLSHFTPSLAVVSLNPSPVFSTLNYSNWSMDASSFQRRAYWSNRLARRREKESEKQLMRAPVRIACSTGLPRRRPHPHTIVAVYHAVASLSVISPSRFLHPRLPFVHLTNASVIFHLSRFQCSQSTYIIDYTGCSSSRQLPLSIAARGGWMLTCLDLKFPNLLLL